MGSVRAKFRCMRVTKSWDKTTTVVLSPVTEKTDDEGFWKYTPSGECELSYYQEDPPFEPGAYYYIDLQPVSEHSEGIWAHNEKTDQGNGQGTVKLSVSPFYDYRNPKPGMRHSRLELGIDSQPAFDALGEPGSFWRVSFTFAEASDS